MSRKKSVADERRLIWLLLVLLIAALAAGRLGFEFELPLTPVPPSATQTSLSSTFPTATPWSALTTSAPATGTREIVILHTNDEHGRLMPAIEKGKAKGGAAQAEANWLARGLKPAVKGAPVLLLSGGDSLTGDAISTWFEGESTIEIMNAMGYAASAAGNHDFDFGQEALAARARQARFPYLAANVLRKGTQEVAAPFQPYALFKVNGVRVGIVGLALESTPRVTAIKNLEGLTFGDPEAALRRWVPVVREQGADLVVALTHICPQELSNLAERVQELDISLFLGGHCHIADTEQVGKAYIAASSAQWNDYVLTRIAFDLAQRRVVAMEQEIVKVSYAEGEAPQPAPETARLLAKWEERTELVLGEVIGYTASGLSQHSAQMHNLLVDSWLWAYPADVAISNRGGFREGLKPGDITLGDIVVAFPFQNELLEIELTGQDLADAVRKTSQDIVVGGIKMSGERLLLANGKPVNSKTKYRVLIIDYVYNNSKYPFKRYDSKPYETGIPWRQPVIDWIRAQHSDAQNPIEKHIAPEERL
ncbi:MAG: bifunctional metallophosphatase/5'-nucleotidase [Chloroflexi bacterium]|nr:bifunctional metallophosphatase/5'-nucleotidase [Chloroflexota bacterium]